MKKYNTGTAKQIVERLKEEGYYLTESSLRTWVRMGIIPSARCGRKVYIYYPNVVQVLQEESGNRNAGTGHERDSPVVLNSDAAACQITAGCFLWRKTWQILKNRRQNRSFI